MVQVGKVKGSEITTNKDGTFNVRLLQVEITDPDDVQTIEQAIQVNDDTNPPLNSEVLVLSVSPAFKLAIVLNDGIEPTMEPGERKIYSTENGAIKAFVNLLKTGIIEINGDADFAVRYNALQTAFDELKSAFNSHTHPGVESGGSSTGAATPQSSADITASKVDEIKVP